MKARIKKTGEIINIAEGSMIELDICNSSGNPVRVFPDEIELIQESSDNIDWQERRYEIAKAAMQGFCANGNGICVGASFKQYATWAKKCADALIEELIK